MEHWVTTHLQNMENLDSRKVREFHSLQVKGRNNEKKSGGTVVTLLNKKQGYRNVYLLLCSKIICSLGLSDFW